MSNEQKQNRGPSHIAYHVREGEENKAYFNRIGSVWPHKDGEGFNIKLDALPVDGRITVRSVQDRLQEAKENARDDQGGERREERREPSREQSREERGSGREASRTRDAGPRYER